MKTDSEELCKKAVKFFFTSGIGFILDFCAYTFMTQVMNFDVLWANFLSSLIGATFAFFVSTYKIFDKKNSHIPVYVKYIAYIVYQLILISLVSILCRYINALIINYFEWKLLIRYSKLASKVIITPVTMTCNFFVMHFFSEKI